MILSAFIAYFVGMCLISLVLAELFKVGNSAEVPIALFVLLIIVTGLIGFGVAYSACESNKRNEAIQNNIGFYASTNGAFYFKNLNDK